MECFFIKYFGLIMIILFITYNFLLGGLYIKGVLYKIYMIIVIIINAIILIKYKRIIKYKLFVILAHFVMGLFSKDTLQLLFSISTVITLLVDCFMESNFIRIISVVLMIFYEVILLPLLIFKLILLKAIMLDELNSIYIYEDTHYYCDNRYEMYSYSAGAMDGFHYNLDKHYFYLNINDIMYISFTVENKISSEVYHNYLNTYSCRLAGDADGFK